MDNKYQNFDWSKLNLDFGNWEEEKIWALDLPTEEFPISELLWHLNVPFWENDLGQRWSVTPQDVVNGLPHTTVHAAQIQSADESFPIEIYFNKDRWLILDGIHRLTKLFQGGKVNIKVRKLPVERFNEVKSEYPIELP